MAALKDIRAVHEDIEYIGTLVSLTSFTLSAEMHRLHEQYSNNISLKQRLPVVLASRSLASIEMVVMGCVRL